MALNESGGGVTVRVAARGSAANLEERLAAGDGTVAAVGSTGVPAVEPLVSVTAGAQTAFFPRCSAETADSIATGLGDGFEAVAARAETVVDHESDPAGLPAPALDGLGAGDRQVLGPCGWLRPTDPDDYAAAVGFDQPDAATIRDVGGSLRGRGWGDWQQDAPLAEAWETAREAGEPTVVVNAHGTDADTLLLSSAPFAVLHGASAVARATGADRIVVFLSTAAETAQKRAHAAAERYPDPPAPIEVVTGPDVYRAAEPTMSIEAIEGNHRLEARLRPPGPDSVGVDGEPTVVHTARTVAHLAAGLVGDSLPGTRLVSVTGDVAAPATVELPESAALADALAAVDVEGEYKAACVGGRFGGVTESLDLAPDPETLTDAGLGTEGVVDVLAADRCVVKYVGERAQFAADTNCGRCVPCREGTTQLADLLREVYDGSFEPGRIEELIGVMHTSSICTFGVDAGRPTRTAITAFESEFQAHADGRCPAGACPQLTEVSP